MLFASGQLSTRFGGPSVMLPVEQDLIDLLYKPTQWEVSEDADSHFRRSVYLIAKRNLRLPFLDVFDQPDLQTSCAQRESSTHAPQALELLNGRLSNSLAAAFSERLQRDGSDPVRRAFLLTFGRPPRPEERRTVEQFLGQHELRKFALAMFNTNGFLYVD